MAGVPLRLKLCLISHFAGGVFPDVKSFDTVICELYKEYPAFIKDDIDKFDGCRFGPLSSKAISSFIDAIHTGYFNRYYLPGHKTPHTTVFKLTDVGDFVANHLISSTRLLEDMGLYGKKIDQIIAIILSFTTVPISIATAYSLYLDRISKKELYKRTAPQHAPPTKESFALSPSMPIFQKLKESINSSWKIVEMDVDVDKREDKVVIPYAIWPKFVEERYAYLCPTKEEVKALLDRAEIAKEYSEELKFLEEMIVEFTPLEHYKIKRLENIMHMVKEKPEIPKLYVNKLSEKLSEIYRNYLRIKEDGYDHVIIKFIKKIAKRSVKLYENESDFRNKLHSVVDQNGHTTFNPVVPQDIKNLFKPRLSEETWNYGFVFHATNCIQLPENTYFTCNNRHEYVTNAGINI